MLHGQTCSPEFYSVQQSGFELLPTAIFHQFLNFWTSCFILQYIRKIIVKTKQVSACWQEYATYIWATVLSTSLGKTFLAWHLISNENILFWLTISYQKPFFSCFCVLFSNSYPKIKLTVKHWSDLCNFYSKVLFLFTFWLRNYFIFFFIDFELLMSHNNIVKISKKIEQVELVENLPPNHLP